MNLALNSIKPKGANLDIRDILAVVDIQGDQPASQTAIELAVLCGAHVTGLSLVYDLYLPFVGYGVLPAEVIVDARKSALSAASTAAKRFQAAAEKAGCSYGSRSEDKIFFGDFTEVVRQARLTDLAVVRRDDGAASESMRSPLIEALLFEGGSPILVVPEKPAPLQLDRVLVAWDGSAPAARALRSALPLLARSTQIDVVIVNDGRRKDSERGVDVGTYLGRHGLSAAVRRVDALSGGVAETILDVAKKQGSSLLVMGAYEHSRFREHLFGGATFDLLRDSPIPVLMTH